jgi:signal recognition particle receptor subunit beta
MAPNVGALQLDEKLAVELIDVPGHPRLSRFAPGAACCAVAPLRSPLLPLRSNLLNTYAKRAKAIVFVIDSVLFNTELRDVAAQLYAILTHNDLVAVPILLCCNKQARHLTSAGQAAAAQRPARAAAGMFRIS